MAVSRLWHLGAILGLALALVVTVTLQSEEDFAFESDQPQEVTNRPISHPTSQPVQRLWGIPDIVASTGRLFHMAIPRDAFSGDVSHYEAQGPAGAQLPSWLMFDKEKGLFEGVPSSQDLGENYVTVRAFGQFSQDWAKDVFSIEVIENSRKSASLKEQHHKCNVGEDATVLTIVMDARFDHLKPKQRVAAIKNLSGFLSLHHDLFQIQPLNGQDDLLGDTVVLAGPGNVKKRVSKYSSAIQWQVGCDGHLWKQYNQLIDQLKHQARDGTLSEVLLQPVVGWHVKTDSLSGQRERREIGSGAGDYDDEALDEDETEGDDDEEDIESGTEVVPSVHIVPTMPSPVFPEATASHPHRHHHGEVEPGLDISMIPEHVSSVGYRLPTSPIVYGTVVPVPTPVLVPGRPTHLVSSDVLVEPSRAYENFAEITPSATPVFISEVEPSVTTDVPTSQEQYGILMYKTSLTHPPVCERGLQTEFSVTNIKNNIASQLKAKLTSSKTALGPSVTEPLPSKESTPSSTPLFVTEERSTTEKSTTEQTSTSSTTESIEFEVKNIQPTIDHRLPKQAATAGKAFRFLIPENSFSDLEDGNTRNLRLIFKTIEGTSVPPNSWLQFDPESQEEVTLPLEEHVSKWEFIVEAMDKEGKSVSDTLDVLVQHHKGRRTVNHEFSLQLRIEKKFDFASSVDWQLKILDGLARLYGDPDTSNIIVRSINEDGPVTFVWTNETLPRNHCPKEEINKLYKMLVLNDDGDPSTALKDILSPSLKPKKVTQKGLHHCEPVIGKPHLPPPPPKVPHENFPPSLRNQVDHINATVGKLLVFKVPEDTFYDPEDGSTRSMKLTLLTIDRAPISLANWLQFDIKNQEFYGIPMQQDDGRKEYQLVCEDSGGLTANDGLVVVVHAAPRTLYNVKFGMILDTPTNAVSISSITEGSTIVTWYNRTLPTDICPEEDISRLRKVLVNDDQSISDRVRERMSPEFNVQAIKLTPTGKCQGELTEIHIPDSPGIPLDDTQQIGSSDERRRTGKMNVGDEDERQSFRNKGIPVIFQDELEERPDPGNKSPVIMKEEKPPLPPPEYQRGEPEHPTSPPTAAHPLLGETTTSEDPPYQPPPPFTSSRDTGRQNRPKPTPTYRKPPPYVPP
ncbi:hypothetical protein L9F63_021629 [Diploptera punctata]|uniref:Dystroglycan 1 n=1 Tax=Diploptera punctata TaxID=6984 RepID=A0AAD7ZP58_DIPPU|nr:hypothetical protein L9F63_021629 [Diploptera punctata]